MNKAKRKSFDSHFEPTSNPGEVFHSAWCGKLLRSTHGNRYFCTFMDQHLRYIHVVGVRWKSNTKEGSEAYKGLVQVS